MRTTAPLTFVGLALMALAAVGCGEAETAYIEIRADAVEPAADVDVLIVIDGELDRRVVVEPGTKVALGDLEDGTEIRATVANARDAGTVRIHILGDECFRASELCSGSGCTATAEYVVEKTGCPNY